MNEEKQMADVAKALGLSEVVPEIYRDMLQPAAKKLGSGLTTVAEAVCIALAPLEASTWAYKEIKEWIALRVTRIHVDRKTKNIVAPPLSIAGPLVLQLVFSRDEPDLRELYASLLASAMDASESIAHPSFVTVIQQLTSDEARLLRHLANSSEEWPSLYASRMYDGSTKEPSIATKFKDWCKEAGVTYIDGSDAYLDNLIRLRVFSLSCDNQVSYEPYEESVTNYFSDFLELTSYGRLFLSACIEKASQYKVIL